jgi:dolichyl-phosphate-mannose--protein O-mannosyl transferase
MRWLRRPVVAIVVITALAGVVRFMHLSHPPSLVFDEAYYPKAACILLGWSDETCMLTKDAETYWRERQWDVGSWVHPPLGKWQIAMGIKAFGMDPFGWRAATALIGTLTVTLLAIIAFLLWRSIVWTYVAGLLLAFEHMSVVMSRTALLDTHLTFWVVAALLCLLLDRRWIDRRQRALDDAVAATAPDVPTTDPMAVAGEPFPRDVPAMVLSPLWRPWRLACGVALGAAISVKWSGASAVAAVLLLTLLWETTRRHIGERRWPGALGRALARESLGVLLLLIVVPAAVFMLTWTPWLHHFDWDMTKWVNTQADTYRFHFGGGIEELREDPETGEMTPTHAYYARPIGWLVLARPTSFFFEDRGPEMEQILGIGSPAVFWASLLALPYTLIAWRRLRDWRAGYVVVPFLVQWAAWLRVSRPTFFFYVTPLIPSMVLAVAYLLRQLSDATLVAREPDGEVARDPDTGEPAISTAYVYRPFVWVFLVAALAVFIWFWPVLTAGRISDLRYPTIVWFPGWI